MPAVKQKPKKSRRTSSTKSENKVSRTHRPPDMSLEEWQIALRRQFGREQKFKLHNIGGDPIFSEFAVTNPDSRSEYRVTVRGLKLGESSCTCPDFMTNALGTCKHVEFVLAKVGRKKGVRAAIAGGYRPAYSEVFLQYGSARQVRFLPGERCPPELLALVGRYFDPAGLLPQDAIASFDKFIANAGTFDHELRVSDDALGFIAEIKDRAERHRLIDAAFPAGVRSAAFKKLVKSDLYGYQREGALFAARAGRSLIADEMGLGKTIQAIAAAEIMARHLGVTRVLIVCPTSLKHQWEREIKRFIGRSACVINGLRPQREVLYRTDNSFFKITNYDTVHRDLDLINDYAPDLVILDEAQRIKNWNTRAARSVKRIASPYGIVLTGTPLENRLEELVSIVQFVDQHRLGPTFRFLADHQLLDEHGKVVGYRDLDSIGQTLAPIMIRRQKSQVLKELPPRLDKNFFVQMTPEQMTHHEENREIVARIVHKWRTTKFLSETDKQRLMIALQNMRMSCNSTFLLDGNSDFGRKADELLTVLEELFERPGTKVVIFSQWLRTHELIQRRLNPRKIGHVLFHGGVRSVDRKALIDRFRDDEKCRVFLSTDAGGVGLNLQHASVVINMDLPWNPAVLEQRIGRIHRLGQQQPVQVFNFVSQGTIEEGMLGVLKFKKSLFAGALDGGEKEVHLGGSRLTRFMETVEKTASTIPPAPPAEEPEERGGDDDGIGAASADDAAASGQSGNGQSANGQPGQPSATPDTPQPTLDLPSLVQAGLAWLQQLSAAGGTPAQGQKMAASSARPASPGPLVRQDAESGETYLHVPVPNPDALNRFLSAAADLLQNLRK